MWWLVYHRATKTEVIIVKASSLIQARMRASIAGLDEGASFHEGHELHTAMARRVPRDSIGKMLTSRQAQRVLTKLVADNRTQKSRPAS